MNDLAHFFGAGRAHMVDVSVMAEIVRVAIASERRAAHAACYAGTHPVGQDRQGRCTNGGQSRRGDGRQVQAGVLIQIVPHQ